MIYRTFIVASVMLPQTLSAVVVPTEVGQPKRPSVRQKGRSIKAATGEVDLTFQTEKRIHLHCY